MIAVAGEALIDMVVQPDGQLDARPGGGPYNTARTLARLGAETAFLDRLSSDVFGILLRDRLTEAGVTLAVPEPTDAPTTLALANVDQAGVPSFAFYLDGTSAADLHYEHLKAAVVALKAQVTAVHIGTLGLIMEPIGAAIERFIRDDVPPAALVMLDPNCRPGAVSNHQTYRERLSAIAHRADIVKASIEDLGYLYPGKPVAAAAEELRADGPALVLVTDGPGPARAFLPGTMLAEEVPAVPVADTIGAGDAFGGGFLAWWTAHGLGRDDLRRDDLRRTELVKQALTAAVGTAALTCTRAGADPPALAELQARNWWPRGTLLPGRKYEVVVDGREPFPHRLP